MAVRSFIPVLLYMTGGLILWAGRFLAAYSFTAVACARGWQGTGPLGLPVIPSVIVVMTVAAAGAALLLGLVALARMRRGRGPDDDSARAFIHQIAAMMAGIGIVAMLWETVPAFTVPFCG